MELQLQGKVALVTGGARGIGFATAQRLASEGAKLAIVDVNGAAAEEAAKQLRAGIEAIGVAADISREDEVKRMTQTVVQAFGRFDILVNSAAGLDDKLFLDSTPQDWAPQIDVTVTGTLQVTHAVAKRMADRGAGSIVNLMGDSGRVGESGLLVTATARSTTVGLTRSLARELARFGIRANAVSLALVRTDNIDAHTGGAEDERMKKILAQYPLRRLGRPGDIVPMVLLLASPLSSWTTGQVVSVNGGYAMP